MSIENETNFQKINKLTDMLLSDSSELKKKMASFNKQITGMHPIEEQNKKKLEEMRGGNDIGWLAFHYKEIEKVFDNLSIICGEMANIRYSFCLNNEDPTTESVGQIERRCND